MVITDLINVSGRGTILLCKYTDSDYFFKIGDMIYHNNIVYEIVGIECTRKLSDPPTISNNVGLNVKKVDN